MTDQQLDIVTPSGSDNDNDNVETQAGDYHGAYVNVGKLTFPKYPLRPTPYTDEYYTTGIDNITDQNYLIKMINEISNEKNHAFRDLIFLVQPRMKFDDAIDNINRKLIEMRNPQFNTPIPDMSETEEVNGYKLYNVDGTANLFVLSFYEKLIELMDSKKEWTFEEWRQAMEKTCCSDWMKQDRHGVCFGGFWRYPEGSYEKENAYNLSFEDNCMGMFELPFSKELLLETIEIGCCNRLESVRYSNFLCVWLQRKRAAIDKAKNN